MRKFVNATIAGATAVALTFGATSVANAGLSSEVGDNWNAGTDVVGTDIWGSSTKSDTELKDEDADWAANMRAITYAGIGAAVFTMIIAPAYNFLAYNNILPLPKW
ncbi:hypothetical protein CKALI_00605 [Corynebacterium kalinowskii]|uniref:Secreted protein n=1 Tax=Corynebacterium kalinowskii TaxID=2675216 RepID=A0A6B8V7A7_9CORY|nr:hypothetical protein [Corynebacterium kalinowskii]QGU01022.1 hypothetical protein CKALI_00605 [Corynebacterium kalinowskii]